MHGYRHSEFYAEAVRRQLATISRVPIMSPAEIAQYLKMDEERVAQHLNWLDNVPAQRFAFWQFPDGSLSLMSLGDEIEVSYPDIRPIPHRGLIYRLGSGLLDDISVMHCSKQAGVCETIWSSFEGGQEVRLRRRASSSEHARSSYSRQLYD